MADTDTKKATKQINKAFGQIDSMLNSLKNGIETLKRKKEENREKIKSIQAENTQLNTQVCDAESLKTNLEKLKG